jgi:hypothetical protein
MSIRHVATGKFLVAEPNGRKVYLEARTQLDGWSTWSIGPRPNAPGALRPFNNPNLNLNALGGCSPSPNIGLWEWGGGQGNEVWFFQFTDGNPPPSRFAIKGGCPGGDGWTAHLAKGGPAQAAVVCGSFDYPSSTWRVEPAIVNRYFLGGVTMINESNGQLLKFLGSRARVGFIDGFVDASTAWTFGNLPNQSFAAIRPLADETQNLAVEGGCGAIGRPICAWDWGGGGLNEKWYLLPV